MNTILALLIQYKYLILFPIAAFEGPIIALVAGFLVFIGALEPIPAYLVLIFGDIIPDVIYYYIGYRGSSSKIFEKYFSKEGGFFNNLNFIKILWFKHGIKTMIMSKLAYALSTPLLISAGLVRMPFSRFISYTVPISLVNYGIFLTVGYYLGFSYSMAEKYLRYFGYSVLIIFVIFVVALFFISKYFRRQIIKEKEEIERNPENL